MTTPITELKQHTDVLQGLIDMITIDAGALNEYLTTTQDPVETKLVVTMRFQERMVETLKRLDITVGRVKYHAQTAVNITPRI